MSKFYFFVTTLHELFNSTHGQLGDFGVVCIKDLDNLEFLEHRHIGAFVEKPSEVYKQEEFLIFFASFFGVKISNTCFQNVANRINHTKVIPRNLHQIVDHREEH